jgi:hypothetical protein
VRFFTKLVWILTRSLIWKSLYICTGNRWRSVVPFISPWRWRATSSLWIYWRTTRLQEGSPKQVDVQEKMLEGFLGEWFWQKITRNPKFLLDEISLGSSTWSKENKLVEMREKGASWRSSFENGLNLFVKGTQKIG